MIGRVAAGQQRRFLPALDQPVVPERKAAGPAIIKGKAVNGSL